MPSCDVAHCHDPATRTITLEHWTIPERRRVCERHWREWCRASPMTTKPKPARPALNATHRPVLAVVVQQPGATAKTIAAATGMERRAVKCVVFQLRQRGYIAPPDDRRWGRAFPTTEGRQAANTNEDPDMAARKTKPSGVTRGTTNKRRTAPNPPEPAAAADEAPPNGAEPEPDAHQTAPKPARRFSIRWGQLSIECDDVDAVAELAARLGPSITGAA